MARSEARLSVTIWTDTDFTALSPTAQRMFMFLLSQPDLAHTGVLALRERRWSKSAAGLTVAAVTRDLEELAEARFVVVDEDAEELLIRSFIRGDKVYRQPNVFRAAAEHLAVITSRTILAALSVELRRVLAADDIHKDSVPIAEGMLKGIGNPSGNPSPNPSGGVLTDPADEPERGTEPGPAVVTQATTGSSDDANAERDRAGVSAGGNPSGNPSGKGIGKASRNPLGDRGVVTAVRRDSPSPVPRSSFPVPHTPGSTTSALASLDAAAPGDVIEAEIVDPSPPSLFVVPDPPGTDLAERENAGQITRQWVDYCKGKGVKLTTRAIKRYAASIKDALDQQFEPDLIRRALGDMFRDRVISRPALFDNYLTRVQTGPEMGPRRMTRTEESIARTAPPGAGVGDLIRDALTRPA